MTIAIMAPKTNPPICAQKAMPVELLAVIKFTVPLNNCPANHIPKKIKAGIGMNSGIIKIGIKGQVFHNNALFDFFKDEARKLRFYLTFRLCS